MTCEEALVLLSGELDGVNTEEESRELHLHLAQCPDCRVRWKQLQSLNRSLQDLKEEPPEGLREDIMAQIRREAAGKKRKERTHWIGLAAAAVLVLAVGAASLGELRTAEQQPEPVAMARTMTDASATVQSEELVCAPMEADSPEKLAQKLGSDVVVLHEALPELENCAYEMLSDGSILYWLETAELAEKLGETYGLKVYSPEEKADASVSYAVLYS